ncbi:Ephrin-B2a [Lucilia cuprina]|nr:Ephrin-B2a [Lucilia cuprina]
MSSATLTLPSPLPTTTRTAATTSTTPLTCAAAKNSSSTSATLWSPITITCKSQAKINLLTNSQQQQQKPQKQQQLTPAIIINTHTAPALAAAGAAAGAASSTSSSSSATCLHLHAIYPKNKRKYYLNNNKIHKERRKRHNVTNDDGINSYLSLILLVTFTKPLTMWYRFIKSIILTSSTTTTATSSPTTRATQRLFSKGSIKTTSFSSPTYNSKSSSSFSSSNTFSSLINLNNKNKTSPNSSSSSSSCSSALRLKSSKSPSSSSSSPSKCIRVLPPIATTTSFFTLLTIICLETILLSTMSSCAKTFYMHWNTSNSIFRIDNTDHIIDVNKGNLAFEFDQVHIICPVYEPGTFDNETEKYIIYNVSKVEYETCRITNADPRVIAICDKPQKLMFFTITFRPFTPQPGGLEFLPGNDYYFISTSSKDDLYRRIGGRCSTNKVLFQHEGKMIPILSKLSGFYSSYVLGVLTIGYILGELGHYLIGVTSKQTAMELDYGDISCQQNNSMFLRTEVPTQCADIKNETSCVASEVNGTAYCEWNYNGLGIEYQILAGPTFILIFTIAGVFMGIAADKYNRVKMLTVCTLVFAVAIILQGTVKEYWQLALLRMIMAAGESGCNPLATGIMSDIFPEDKRALVMAIFNWGIYGGYGIAFPVGRYITQANFFGMGWRVCYLGAGILAILIAALTGTTLKEPERKVIGDNEMRTKDGKKANLWSVLKNPAMIMLMIAASIRHSGGMTFAYNADLYYNTYFPDTDLGWWLFAVTIGIGSVGVVVGGVVSDKIVAKMGIRSRAFVLAISQLIATLPAFGSVYFDPLWAMITLGGSYFFAEMWFGIVFAIVVEIVPLQVRSSTIGVFLFVMNNIGGNLPIFVDPVAKAIGYRGAIMIFYAGMYGISSILFLITCFMLEGKPQASAEEKAENGLEVPARNIQGHDNSVFSNDEPPAYPNGKSNTALPNHLQMYNNNTNSHKPQIQESSRL